MARDDDSRHDSSASLPGSREETQLEVFLGVRSFPMMTIICTQSHRQSRYDRGASEAPLHEKDGSRVIQAHCGWSFRDADEQVGDDESRRGLGIERGHNRKRIRGVTTRPITPMAAANQSDG